MYSTCLHCHASLGTNAMVEHFAIGRRLAFDAARGRLWVVCGKCHRWNLTPLEERWEAVEECERLYSSTRLRSSTDNIGLARLREGLELVRIGRPLQPEINAWRYAADFRRRWVTRAAPLATASVTGYALQVLLQSQFDNAPLATAFPLLGVIAVGAGIEGAVFLRRSLSKLVLPDGRVTTRRRGAREVKAARLDAFENGWSVRMSPLSGSPSLTGNHAIHALRAATTFTNYYGGRKAEVDAAFDLLDAVGDPGAYITRLARVGPERGFTDIGSYPNEIRLALEIALHDDVERRALAGELAALEAEWAMAEEIARIADNLLLPHSVTEGYDALINPSAP